MKERIYNFNAGPAVLPEEVLKEAQENLYSLPSVGMSVLEISHRSETFNKIIDGAKEDLKSLLSIPDNYHILFLQGGASTQFAMVPMNIMPPNNKAAYLVTGAWSKKAVKEAKRVGEVNIAASSEGTGFDRIPKELNLAKDASYVHFTSNNTIYGTEWNSEPEVGDIPLVCDASSDILHKKIDVSKYGIIYAGAQKNMGPSGVTLVIIRDDLLQRSPDSLFTMLNYNTHAEKNSMFNTPPVFGVYMIGLVTKWLKNLGGLDAMNSVNKEKAEMLYNCIDESDGFYKGHAQKDSRSVMNVTFNLTSEELEKKLIAEALENGFGGVKGHRSIGGLRASIYNACPKVAVEELVKFMKDFQQRNG